MTKPKDTGYSTALGKKVVAGTAQENNTPPSQYQLAYPSPRLVSTEVTPSRTELDMSLHLPQVRSVELARELLLNSTRATHDYSDD